MDVEVIQTVGRQGKVCGDLLRIKGAGGVEMQAHASTSLSDSFSVDILSTSEVGVVSRSKLAVLTHLHCKGKNA